MRLPELVGAIAERTRLEPAQAEQLLTATLATLSEHLTNGEAHDLAAQLPDEVQPALARGLGERFDYDELVRRVMVRADLTPDRAGIQTSAALASVRDAVSHGEWEDVLAQLPGADPVAATAGEPPADSMAEDFRRLLAEDPNANRWQRLAGRDEWTIHSHDRMKQGFVAASFGDAAARVYRRPTGPTGPPLELSHGPQVFTHAEDALRYVTERLGD